MGRFRPRSLWLACHWLWLGGCLSTAAVAEVWLVTGQRHPVTISDNVRLIELDAPARLQGQLNAQLPADQEHAAEIARNNLANLTEAWRGLVDAWQLGVHTVPAVVVDRQYVVYGTTDVETALGRIDTFRGQQP